MKSIVGHYSLEVDDGLQILVEPLIDSGLAYTGRLAKFFNLVVSGGHRLPEPHIRPTSQNPVHKFPRNCGFRHALNEAPRRRERLLSCNHIEDAYQLAVASIIFVVFICPTYDKLVLGWWQELTHCEWEQHPPIVSLSEAYRQRTAAADETLERRQASGFLGGQLEVRIHHNNLNLRMCVQMMIQLPRISQAADFKPVRGARTVEEELIDRA
jgi:hypothetical protein